MAVLLLEILVFRLLGLFPSCGAWLPADGGYRSEESDHLPEGLPSTGSCRERRTLPR